MTSREDFKEAFQGVHHAYRARDVPKLVAYLTDPAIDPGSGLSVRAAAARKLGKLRTPLAVDRLVELLRDDDLSVRLAVIGSLGRIQDNRAKTALVETLRSATGEAEIAMLLKAIEATGGLPPEDPLAAQLSRSSNRRIRKALGGATGQSISRWRARVDS